jgi:hypothetical protein
MQLDHDKVADAVARFAKRYVDSVVQPLKERIRELESRPVPKDGIGISGAVKNSDGVLILTLSDGRVLETGVRDGTNGRNGEDGDAGVSVDPEEVRALVDAGVSEQVARLEETASIMVDRAVTAAVEAITEKLTLPELPDIGGLVEAAVARLPAPAPGKDADMAAVASMIEARVKDAVSALPVAKDGVGLAGAMISREGSLILTLTNGTTRDLGRVEGKDADMAALRAEVKAMVDAIPRPRDGIDALGFDNLDFTVTEDGAFLVFARGEHKKAFRLPIVIDRGVFKDGTAYRSGDGVTWGGSFWIAQRDTKSKPDANTGDWRLAVKKGRDGKDAKAA